MSLSEAVEPIPRHFDVAVANPGADSYVRCQHTDTIDLAAAIFTENRKFNHYVASYGEDFRPHIRPFVLEATGDSLWTHRQLSPSSRRSWSPQTSASAKTLINLMKALEVHP
jgi:hypothetical protein